MNKQEKMNKQNQQNLPTPCSHHVSLVIHEMSVVFGKKIGGDKLYFVLTHGGNLDLPLSEVCNSTVMGVLPAEIRRVLPGALTENHATMWDAIAKEAMIEKFDYCPARDGSRLLFKDYSSYYFSGSKIKGRDLLAAQLRAAIWRRETEGIGKSLANGQPISDSESTR